MEAVRAVGGGVGEDVVGSVGRDLHPLGELVVVVCLQVDDLARAELPNLEHAVNSTFLWKAIKCTYERTTECG